jgi:heme-degrading monooxygenase HmoA
LVLHPAGAAWPRIAIIGWQLTDGRQRDNAITVKWGTAGRADESQAGAAKTEDPMHARVTRFQFRPDQVEAGIRFFDSTTSEIRDVGGFRRAVLLLDRASHEGMAITFWNSESDVQASAEGARQIFARAAAYLAGTPERHTFEVALDTDAL